MTYRVLFIDHADVVGEYRSEVEARESLAEYIGAHPHLIDEMGILPIDENGRAAGKVLLAEDVVGQQMQLR